MNQNPKLILKSPYFKGFQHSQKNIVFKPVFIHSQLNQSHHRYTYQSTDLQGF